ncbi:MAG: glycosyltransferase family 4 protein [Firmicutes bacterium]|nr:glycosyltransferase family 4 protein [Bacillota bacterium]
MKVILAIYSLAGAGGAERVVSIMAGYWAEKGWNVKIVTFDDGSKPTFNRLHPDVQQRSLLSGRNNHFIMRLLRYCFRYLLIRRSLVKERPDAIITFASGTNMKILRAMLFSPIPVIVSERNYYNKSSRSFFLRLYRNWLYSRARAVVCQTQAMKDTLPVRLQRKSVIIPNPVLKGNGGPTTPEITLPEGKILFAVGHMSRKKIYQKGLDLLIPLFSKLAQKHSCWQLVILNDGPDRHLIEKEIEKYNLKNRVFLPGRVQNIYSVFQKGNMFVLPSRFEGFPNALCEAMACGLPVVSFDCPTGPADIIRHGIDGYLVPAEDTAALEQALDRLMSDDELRRQMGRRAAEIVDRFSVEKVMAMWEELICG